MSPFSSFNSPVGRAYGKVGDGVKIPQGVYISTELGKRWENVWLALTTQFGKGKKVLFPIPTMRSEDALYLRDIAEQGSFRPVIDREYTLDEIVQAHRYTGTGQKTGNVIISVAPIN